MSLYIHPNPQNIQQWGDKVWKVHMKKSAIRTITTAIDMPWNPEWGRQKSYDIVNGLVGNLLVEKRKDVSEVKMKIYLKGNTEN